MRLKVYSLIIGICLAGCGQTGPLYMPQDANTEVAPPAQAAAKP